MLRKGLLNILQISACLCRLMPQAVDINTCVQLSHISTISTSPQPTLITHIVLLRSRSGFAAFGDSGSNHKVKYLHYCEHFDHTNIITITQPGKKS